MDGQVRVIVYSRVSTDAQERDGTSLDTQERACIEYAQAKGWQVVECIRDAASGYSLERPGIVRLQRLLQEGTADIVVSYAVDRLSRNQNHIGVLFDTMEQSEARMEFVTENFEDTAVGRFILAARAFIAEVEREKIAERTAWGKAERARQGRIPHGMGKGTYGYIYNPETGQREIDPAQAAIVRRVFQRYAEMRSFSAVTNELNAADVPSFTQGRWYPLTIRRILTNESYTGKLVYRRTQRVKVRSTNGKKPRSRVVERPEADWIEIDGASPPIIDEAVWRRVQEILSDPERTKQRPRQNFYALRGRMKCGVCGAAMVGQTLTTKGKPYKYYRCRHLYDRNTSWRCSARYVPADLLEDSIWSQVKQVLSDPTIVFQEMMRQSEQIVDHDEVTRLERELAELEERERRLVQLFTLGQVSDTAIGDEANAIRPQRALREEQLRALHPATNTNVPRIDASMLEQACSAVAAWLDQAGDDDRVLALEALQIAIVATREEAELTGVLPIEAPEFISAEQLSR